MKTLTLKVPEALEAQLTAVAQQKGTSKSQVVRDALREYLSRGNRPLVGSLFTMAKDLAGCVEGPTDLSVNKAHLQGYGE